MERDGEEEKVALKKSVLELIAAGIWLDDIVKDYNDVDS